MEIYERLKRFKQKYPNTVAWRLKAHASVIEKHLNPGEDVIFVFAAQKNYSSAHFFNTYAVALTNKRLLLAQKKLIFGYDFLTITPDMFNDLIVNSDIMWGKVRIDTIKEEVILSNISKKALDEIETQITEYMMSEKKKYKDR